MKVQIDKLVQSARGEILCEFCGRQWFGLVAYCPYCGRRPGFTMITQAADNRVESGESPTSGPVPIPARELHAQKDMPAREHPGSPPQRVPTPAENVRDLRSSPGPKAPPEELPRAPLQGGPVPGETMHVEKSKPPVSRSHERASAILFKTAVAGVSALLLFWVGFKFFEPRTNQGPSTQPTASTSSPTSPGSAPSTSTLQLPPAPRADAPVPAQVTAAQAPSVAPRTGTTAAPQTNRSLCSAASEAAGLCKREF